MADSSNRDVKLTIKAEDKAGPAVRSATSALERLQRSMKQYGSTVGQQSATYRAQVKATGDVRATWEAASAEAT